MNKRAKTMMSLVAALAVLLICYSVLKTASVKKAEAERVRTEAASIISDIKDVSGVGLYTESVQLDFIKTDGVWSCERYPSYPINGAELEKTADKIASLTAETVLENPKELSEYGLDKPTYRAYAFNGTERVDYSVSHSAANGLYYLKKEGDSRVFTVSEDVTLAINTDIMSLIDYGKKPTVYSDQITALTLNNGGKAYNYFRVENGEDESGKPVYSWECAVDGQKAEAFSSNVSAAAHDIENLRFIECVAYLEELTGREGFSLNDTVLTVDYTTDAKENKSFTLYIGEQTGSAGELRFMAIDESLAVVTASVETVNEIISLLSSAG